MKVVGSILTLLVWSLTTLNCECVWLSPCDKLVTSPSLKSFRTTLFHQSPLSTSIQNFSVVRGGSFLSKEWLKEHYYVKLRKEFRQGSTTGAI